MRILLISGIYPPDIGGPATFISEFAEFLSYSGHQVKIVTLSDTKDHQKKSNPGIEVKYIYRSQNKLIRAIKTIITIAIESKESDVALVNGLYYEHYLANLFQKNKCVYKIVGDPIWEKYRNSVDPKISILDFQNLALNPKFKCLRVVFNRSLNSADKIVAPGIDLIKIIETWDQSLKVRQISNGVPEELLRGLNKSHDVVSVSRLVNWKNIDLLIKACKSSNLSLLVIGDGPERGKLQQLASELEANVEFVGEKSPEEVRNLIHQAEVFALVSSYEGMSFALLEAMMQQKKIVISNISANQRVIVDGYTGIVTPDLNVVSISASLEKAHHFTSNKLAINARKEALKSYSRKMIYKEYLGILQDVANK